MEKEANIFHEVLPKEKRQLIQKEYDRLKDICYLDQTGSAPYSTSHVQSVMNKLIGNVYSNPHSGSLTGKHCSETIDLIRYKILQHFNTDIDEYSVIFTSGATGALKLVADSFCWKSTDSECSNNEWYPKNQTSSENGGAFIYMEDNHTSVLGMRDMVKEKGAKVICLQHNETLDTFVNRKYENELEKDANCGNSLFVYSAQCNFSGVKYPLTWIQKVKDGILESSSGQRSNWYCLLDAATYISTNHLDLGVYKPDFVCISFYKLFGYPTGLGALLVKNSSAHVLKKSYYGGGTVLISLSSENAYVPRPVLHERFEDGTLNFLSILALDNAFEMLYSLVGSMENISKHCFNLAKYLHNALLTLHHCNGSPVIHLYSDSAYDDINTQGNIVNFNVLRSDGNFIGYAEVLHMANLHGIQLRTGCFCNPGACRRHLGLTNNDLRKHYQSGHVCGDENDLVNGHPTGSVRVSFGHYSTKEDADKLIDMIEKCFIQQPTIRRIPFLWNFLSFTLRNKFNPIENKLIEINHMDFMKYIYYWHEFSADNITEQYHQSKDVYSNKVYDLNTERRNPSFLSHIFVYPLKSCGRFAVKKWQLTHTGLKYDRQWMVVNSSGVALTQKREPKMSMIRPQIDLNLNKLHLSFKGFPDITIDLETESNHMYKSDISICQSKVCNDRVQGEDCGDDVAVWLSTVLDRPGLRLIKQLPGDNRTHKKSKGALTLANQAQYLLINLKTVDWLHDKLSNLDCNKENLLDRFRSNFVISDTEAAFVEENWDHVRIGKSDFSVDGPCGRCQMICIDQDTGQYNKEPLTVLSAHLKGKIKFGVYLSNVTNEEVLLSVGDQLTIDK